MRERKRSVRLELREAEIVVVDRISARTGFLKDNIYRQALRFGLDAMDKEIEPNHRSGSE
jgi:hypothetical protein